MKKLVSIFVLFCVGVIVRGSEWIHVNQPGYAADNIKNAAWVSKNPGTIPSFEIIEKNTNKNQLVHGGIIRGNTANKHLTLVFTGDTYADGYDTIRKTLKKHKIQGAFFLTGNFCQSYPEIVKALQKDGHYLAPHSDKHLLYASWENRDSTLITQEEFIADLENNYQALIEAGAIIKEPRYFMPPYEWYNHEISKWSNDIGVKIVNFTPGTSSNADYTTPDMSSYLSSQEIYNRIMQYEEEDSLNGFLLLSHLGTHPERTDKFYNYLNKLIIELKKKGYQFMPLEEILNTL